MTRAGDLLQELGSIDPMVEPCDPDDASTLLRSAHPPARPLWRGRLHQVAAVIAVPMLAILAASAQSPHALVAVLVYAVGLIGTFSVSALYHRLPHSSARIRSRFQRADHATIFLCIGGSCTPVCLIGLPSAWGIPLLCAVGLGVGVGITCSLIDRRWADITSGALYIVVGWTTVIAIPPLVMHRGWAPAILIAIGGLLYTVGAVLFARGVPRLSVRVFGYHEVWHTFTVLAAGSHFAAIWLLTRG